MKDYLNKNEMKRMAQFVSSHGADRMPEYTAQQLPDLSRDYFMYASAMEWLGHFLTTTSKSGKNIVTTQEIIEALERDVWPVTLQCQGSPYSEIEHAKSRIDSWFSEQIPLWVAQSQRGIDRNAELF